MHRFEGAAPGPGAAIRLTDKRIELELLVHPELALGEGYMAGRIVVEAGSIFDLIEIGDEERRHARAEPRRYRLVA